MPLASRNLPTCTQMSKAGAPKQHIPSTTFRGASMVKYTKKKMLRYTKTIKFLVKHLKVIAKWG